MSEQIYNSVRMTHVLMPRFAKIVNKSVTGQFGSVTLEGEHLDSINPLGPTDHVRIVLPNAEGVLELDEVDDTLRPAPGAIIRDVTVESQWDNRIALDVVLHEDGPLADWVNNAEIGSEVALFGPKSSKLMPPAPKLVLAADASALPALARWLRLANEDQEITAIVSADFDPSEYLGSHPEVDLRVIPVDYTGESLLAAMQAVNPSYDSYVWIAGEATTLVLTRRWLRQASAVNIENIKADGYWRVGEAGRDHHQPIDPADQL